MTQPTLFEPAGVTRRSDPDTSHRAAETVSAGVEAAIYETFQTSHQFRLDGATDDELCDVLTWFHPPTLKSARSRLSKRGLLVDTGARRPSHRGCDQIVWRRGR